jgi:hypothetical protein
VDLTRSSTIGRAWKNEISSTIKEYAKILGVERFLVVDYISADELYKGSLDENIIPLPSMPLIYIPPVQTSVYATASIPLTVLVFIGAGVLMISRPTKKTDDHFLSPNLLHFDIAQQLTGEGGLSYCQENPGKCSGRYSSLSYPKAFALWRYCRLLDISCFCIWVISGQHYH